MNAGEAAVLIEPMGGEDIDEVLPIEEVSYSVPWGRSMFEAELRGNSFARAAVARESNSGPVIGYSCYWVVFDELHILKVTVRPEFRRRGTGRALAEAAVQDASENGVRLATLEVRASNTAARSLYEKLGFKVGAVRSGYYREPREDALIMNRDLHQSRNEETRTRSL